MNLPPPFRCWFRADWIEAWFVHFTLPPRLLQSLVAYPLDLWQDQAWVSLVLFTMRDMRPAAGGRAARLPFWFVREQRFLNVRTYVKVGETRGIHFIAEWISHPLCVLLGQPLYALPYHWGEHTFAIQDGRFRGTVRDRRTDGRYVCTAPLPARRPVPCTGGSREEFLMERYVAFNGAGARRKCFRVAHAPWRQIAVNPELTELSLLRENFSWFPRAEFAGANYSPGVDDVWMGRPET